MHQIKLMICGSVLENPKNLLALVVGEMDSAFRWMDHYTAYKP